MHYHPYRLRNPKNLIRKEKGMRLEARPKSYQECPGFRITAKPSPPELHARVIESYINVCADAVPVNFSRKTIWLAKRRIKPQQDWWWIGGRMQAGETEEVALARKFKAETSLAVVPERFQFVCLNRYFWKDRRQEPQELGCDCLVFIFLVELDNEELRQASLGLNPDEYDLEDGLREFDRLRLIGINVHQAILDFYDRVFS